MHGRIVKRLLSIPRIGHTEQIVGRVRERKRERVLSFHVFVKFLEKVCLFTV